MTIKREAQQNVVFFDDVCVLCNGTVHFLIRIDRKNKLRYSALQGEFAKTLGIQARRDFNDSILFYSGGRLTDRAEAVIQILKTLGGFFGALGWIASLLPVFPLNLIYRTVAKNRYRVFGKNETCLVPSPEVRSRFIP
ncbi:MAG: DUF393 domain-containing protein [Bdellovibrionales bacterium]|nr:DUF393 domain-containing protein [Bdellovibrionales bacterium]